MQRFYPSVTASLSIAKCGSLLALMLALSACSNSDTQIRVSGRTGKQSIQGEPRDIPFAQSRSTPSVASLVPPALASSAPPSANAVR